MLIWSVMTIQQIYNLALEMGISADPRGKDGVSKWLRQAEKKYEKLSETEKKEFHQDRLTNPYSDTNFHVGNPKKEVKTIMAGIDMEEPELMLAAMSKDPIDLVIAHHPIGRSLSEIDDVMNLQADFMNMYGVPINVAEGIMRERIQQVARSVSGANHMKVIDFAKRLNIGLINVHTPADNLCYQYLQNEMDAKKPETVGEVMEIIKNIPEYHQSVLNGAPPMIFAGSPENRAGKVVAYDTTGGTSGAKEAYPELVKAGVGTVISMHMKDEPRDEALKNHLNVVMAGHIASDSLGFNQFLDELEKQGVKIIPLGGLIRVKRTQK